MTDVDLAEPKTFEPGTTGWSIDDLDDPELEARWCAGRYEISDGVLSRKPPATFDGGAALHQLLNILCDQTLATGLGDGFAPGVDLILNDLRVTVVGALFLTP